MSDSVISNESDSDVGSNPSWTILEGDENGDNTLTQTPPALITDIIELEPFEQRSILEIEDLPSEESNENCENLPNLILPDDDLLENVNGVKQNEDFVKIEEQSENNAQQDANKTSVLTKIARKIGLQRRRKLKPSTTGIVVAVGTAIAVTSLLCFLLLAPPLKKQQVNSSTPNKYTTNKKSTGTDIRNSGIVEDHFGTSSCCSFFQFSPSGYDTTNIYGCCPKNSRYNKSACSSPISKHKSEDSADRLNRKESIISLNSDTNSSSSMVDKKDSKEDMGFVLVEPMKEKSSQNHINLNSNKNSELSKDTYDFAIGPRSLDYYLKVIEGDIGSRKQIQTLEESKKIVNQKHSTDKTKTSVSSPGAADRDKKSRINESIKKNEGILKSSENNRNHQIENFLKKQSFEKSGSPKKNKVNKCSTESFISNRKANDEKVNLSPKSSTTSIALSSNNNIKTSNSSSQKANSISSEIKFPETRSKNVNKIWETPVMRTIEMEKVERPKVTVDQKSKNTISSSKGLTNQVLEDNTTTSRNKETGIIKDYTGNITELIVDFNNFDPIKNKLTQYSELDSIGDGNRTLSFQKLLPPNNSFVYDLLVKLVRNFLILKLFSKIIDIVDKVKKLLRSHRHKEVRNKHVYKVLKSVHAEVHETKCLLQQICTHFMIANRIRIMASNRQECIPKLKEETKSNEKVKSSSSKTERKSGTRLNTNNKSTKDIKPENTGKIKQISSKNDVAKKSSDKIKKNASLTRNELNVTSSNSREKATLQSENNKAKSILLTKLQRKHQEYLEVLRKQHEERLRQLYLLRVDQQKMISDLIQRKNEQESRTSVLTNLEETPKNEQDSKSTTKIKKSVQNLKASKSKVNSSNIVEEPKKSIKKGFKRTLEYCEDASDENSDEDNLLLEKTKRPIHKQIAPKHENLSKSETPSTESDLRIQLDKRKLYLHEKIDVMRKATQSLRETMNKFKENRLQFEQEERTEANLCESTISSSCCSESLALCQNKGITWKSSSNIPKQTFLSETVINHSEDTNNNSNVKPVELKTTCRRSEEELKRLKNYFKDQILKLKQKKEALKAESNADNNNNKMQVVVRQPSNVFNFAPAQKFNFAPNQNNLPPVTFESSEGSSSTDSPSTFPTTVSISTTNEGPSLQNDVVFFGEHSNSAASPNVVENNNFGLYHFSDVSPRPRRPSDRIFELLFDKKRPMINKRDKLFWLKYHKGNKRMLQQIYKNYSTKLGQKKKRIKLQ
ncbi:uncharacterized protein LOC108738327 [Agrilus planipennis]|uniref:Uncharacterized protein LOC108738327 n=1 Tax=Agrilus planipennis TaxID=224129 RepID=A0A1W4WTI9_AGRPL|nr:uncharacterized protein LOC108738327 [Agrilus planipennis]